MTFSVNTFSAEHPQLKTFPAAKAGMERYVIVLPHKEGEEEADFRVELIPGKTMLTDGVNKTRLGISLKSDIIIGWGYTYYELSGRDVTISTMMAVPDSANKKTQFVAGTPLLIKYNSRLPIVIYVPTGYEIRYRVWAAPKLMEKAQQG